MASFIFRNNEFILIDHVNNQFDPSKVSCNEVTVEVNGLKYRVYEDVVPMWKRLKKYDPEMIIFVDTAAMNRTHFHAFNVHYLKFRNFVKKIRDRHIEKYADVSVYNQNSLWSAIAHNNADRFYFTNIWVLKCQVADTTSNDNFTDFDTGVISITILIHPDDQDEFCRLWDSFNL